MAKSPAQQSYLYKEKGPVTPLELADHESKMLFPGASYRDLPADNPIVQNLIARKLLVAEDGTAAAETVTPATSEGA